MFSSSILNTASLKIFNAQLSRKKKSTVETLRVRNATSGFFVKSKTAESPATKITNHDTGERRRARIRLLSRTVLPFFSRRNRLNAKAIM